MAMDCECFREKLNALIDDEISPEERSGMELHAKNCAACRAEMEDAEKLREMLMGMNEGLSVPLQAQSAWRQAVRAEAKRKKNAMPAWTKGLSVAAAALVVLVAGTWGTRLNETVPSGPAPTLTLAADNGMTEAAMDGDRRQKGVMPGGVQTLADGLQSDGNTARTTADAVQNTSSVETVVLRSAARTIESDDYDSDALWLDDLVSEYGAYYEERSEMAPSEDGATGRTATAVIRVPSERLDDFLMELDQLGETVMKSEHAEDVTGLYMDTQSRLDALKVQKEKLSGMLTSAETVDDLIAVDDKLTEVIASLEALEGEIRRWESQQNYSRVTLTLAETVEAAPAAQATLGQRMKDGFDGAIVWLNEFGQDALVMLASYAPRLIVLIPAIVLAAVLVWAIARKKRRA